MKVSTCRTVDVDVEVDVDLDDCINEMLQMADTEEGSRTRLAAVDGATKILANVTPSSVRRVLEKNHPGAINLIRKRLEKWLDLLAKTPVERCLITPRLV